MANGGHEQVLQGVVMLTPGFTRFRAAAAASMGRAATAPMDQRAA
jgi:hypothetical protein